MRVADLGGYRSGNPPVGLVTEVPSGDRLCATHTASGLAISHYYREAVDRTLEQEVVSLRLCKRG